MSEAYCFVKMLFRRVQLRRRRFASILLIVSSGIVFVLYFEAYGFFSGFSQSTFPKTRVKFVKHVGNSSSACRLPNLDPFHPSLMKFMKDLGKLQCSGERHSNFRDNVLEVKGEGLHSVRYSVIGRPRGDDFHAELSDPIHLVNEALPEQKQRKANLGRLSEKQQLKLTLCEWMRAELGEELKRTCSCKCLLKRKFYQDL